MSDTNDTDLIAAARKALEGVTQGPWFASSGHVQSNGQLYWQVEDANHAIMQNQFCWTDGDHAANARFIAAARDLIPALLKERDDLRASVRALEEITDPHFIWGAMDNVHDMDVTLDDYAKAVSRAQRAALAASQSPDPVTNADNQQPENPNDQ